MEVHSSPEEDAFYEAVREGLASADRGDFIEDHIVLQWLERRERSELSLVVLADTTNPKSQD